MKKINLYFILILLISSLIFLNYFSIDNFLESFLIDGDFVRVTKVIDGDTFEVDNQSFRLLGINTPEKGEKYFSESRDYLEKLILNKTVKLEYRGEKYDQYNRVLAYVFLNGENINQKIVEGGLANLYFYEKDLYYDSLRESWEKCIESNKNLCEKSEDKCANCINLVEFNFKNEIIVFENKCDFNCDLTGWSIKDEGRKKFVFGEFNLEKNKKVSVIVGEGKDDKSILYWSRKDYVWTDSGDTLFLRDSQGGLVLWEIY